MVACYLEGFRDGRTLIDTKRTEAGIELPIVTLKVGSSPRGGRAAEAHTGADVGDSAVYEDVLPEHGMMMVDGIDSLVSVTETLLLTETLPGGNVGVLDIWRGGSLSGRLLRREGH